MKSVSVEEYTEYLSDFAALVLGIIAVQKPEDVAEAEKISKELLAILKGATGGVAVLAIAGIAVAIARSHKQFSGDLERANRSGQVA